MIQEILIFLLKKLIYGNNTGRVLAITILCLMALMENGNGKKGQRCFLISDKSF